MFLWAGGNASDDENPAGAAAAAAPLYCKVNEQKETVDGLVDAECGNEVQAGNAGLCRLVRSQSVKVMPQMIHLNWFFYRMPGHLTCKQTDRFPAQLESLWST